MTKKKEDKDISHLTEFEQRLEMLKMPFDEIDYEWRYAHNAIDYRDSVQRQLFLIYVTNRAIMNRLDECIGSGLWKVDTIPQEYKKPRPNWDKTIGPKQSMMFTSTISIWNPDINQWISKSDGAEGTAFETIKGGFSASMKRAAVQWGIGRHLYSITDCFAITSSRKRDTILHKSYKNDDKELIWALPPRLPSWAVKEYDAVTNIIYFEITGTDDVNLQNIPLNLQK